MNMPSIGMAEVIRAHGADLIRARGNKVTKAQLRILSDLAVCRTQALGGRLYRCANCDGVIPLYNSCRNRHCPTCLSHRSAPWLDARKAELLPVPYFHVVFTVPQEVAELALGNKRALYSMLFQCASKTLLTIAKNPRHLGARVGFLAILHTWTQTLEHHPHVHCVVPGGGISRDGTAWVAAKDGFFLPVRVLSRLFRGKFIAALEAERARGALQFAGATECLAIDVKWRKWIRGLRKHEWVVYAKRPFGSPVQVLKYLARYTHRVAISNRRILALKNGAVTFSYRDRRHENAERSMTLTAVEFLRRFLLHVLPKRFPRIRYFGFLANRARGKQLARCRALLGEIELEDRDQKLEPEVESSQTETRTVCPTCGADRSTWIEITELAGFVISPVVGAVDTS